MSIDCSKNRQTGTLSNCTTIGSVSNKIAKNITITKKKEKSRLKIVRNLKRVRNDKENKEMTTKKLPPGQLPISALAAQQSHKPKPKAKPNTSATATASDVRTQPRSTRGETHKSHQHSNATRPLTHAERAARRPKPTATWSVADALVTDSAKAPPKPHRAHSPPNKPSKSQQSKSQQSKSQQSKPQGKSQGKARRVVLPNRAAPLSAAQRRIRAPTPFKRAVLRERWTRFAALPTSTTTATTSSTSSTTREDDMNEAMAASQPLVEPLARWALARVAEAEAQVTRDVHALQWSAATQRAAIDALLLSTAGRESEPQPANSWAAYVEQARAQRGVPLRVAAAVAEPHSALDALRRQLAAAVKSVRALLRKHEDKLAKRRTHVATDNTHPPLVNLPKLETVESNGGSIGDIVYHDNEHDSQIQLEQFGQNDDVNDQNDYNQNDDVNDQNDDNVNDQNGYNQIDQDDDMNDQNLENEDDQIDQDNDDINDQNLEINDNHNLSDQNDDLNDQNDDLNDQNDDLNDQNDDLNDQNDDLNDQNDDSNDQNDDLNDQNDDFNDQNVQNVENNDDNQNQETEKMDENMTNFDFEEYAIQMYEQMVSDDRLVAKILEQCVADCKQLLDMTKLAAQSDASDSKALDCSAAQFAQLTSGFATILTEVRQVRASQSAANTLFHVDLKAELKQYEERIAKELRRRQLWHTHSALVEERAELLSDPTRNEPVPPSTIGSVSDSALKKALQAKTVGEFYQSATRLPELTRNPEATDAFLALPDDCFEPFVHDRYVQNAQSDELLSALTAMLAKLDELQLKSKKHAANRRANKPGRPALLRYQVGLNAAKRSLGKAGKSSLMIIIAIGKFCYQQQQKQPKKKIFFLIFLFLKIQKKKKKKKDIEPTNVMLDTIRSLQQAGRKARVPIVYAFTQRDLFKAIGRKGTGKTSFVTVTDCTGAEADLQRVVRAWQQARTQFRNSSKK